MENVESPKISVVMPVLNGEKYVRLAFCEGKKYDLVCSFGFIEHFENYTDIFAKQLQLVKDNGLALIQFPNFYGIVQRFLHYHLDRNNFYNHITQAMNINNYLKIISPDFTIIFTGYYGNFEFW